MLGRKDLTKALGGMPTVPGASAGAGAGGKQGSGGELLVGVGEGVQRTTVGNSGVAGLGGIGTKGAGGGAGGYGTSMVGSGNGRGLSSVPLSQDMILEGGLDRSVIQATIAKYLNQVRACYEEGLRKSPGLVGQVSILFEIAGTGSVNSANVGKSSLGNSEVEQCIATKVQTWQFPKPRGGVNVKVNYPFMLRPVKS
jgi:TonB family protein